MTVLPTTEFAEGLRALPEAHQEVSTLFHDLEKAQNLWEIRGITEASDNIYLITLPHSRVFVTSADAGGKPQLLLLSIKGVESRRGPLPIVIGVTGHRDLRPPDVPALERCVREVFDEMLRTYGKTPLLLLSPLAAGADQLVARVALSYQIPVVAPLPLELEDYERDFTPDELAEFRALLQRARCCYFVGYVGKNDASSVRESGKARNEQYARVGAYVARNSQLLVALWNGLPPTQPDSIGGTAQIVAFKREGRAAGIVPEPGPLDPPESGPVWHIVTPRLHDARELPATAFTSTILWPEPGLPPGALAAREKNTEPKNAEVTALIFRHVDRFNEDALGLGADDRTISTDTIRFTAEKLASRYQRLTMWTLRALYVAGFAAAVSFIAYAHIPPHLAPLIELNLLITIAALFIYFLARSRELQNFHQDYRAIAEGVRIQEQWHIANLRETVADHYLRLYRGELDWIRNAIRVCRLLDDTSAVDTSMSLEQRRARLRAVYETWITGDSGQVKYFEVRAAADERREQRFSRMTWTAAAVGIAATLAVVVAFALLGAKVDVEPSDPSLHGTENFWWIAGVVTISIAAVASGLLASYAEKRAFGIHVKRYRRMRRIFLQAAASLDAILKREPFTDRDYTDAQEVIRELGKEALLENAAWVILHRERPLEFVQGG